MKIAIFVQQLEFMGGVERVVLEQLRIFAAHGVELTLFVERPVRLMAHAVCVPVVVLSKDGATRGKLWQESFDRSRPDMLIFHGVSHECAKSDITMAKKNGIPTIGVVHFAFPGNVALDGRGNSWRTFRENGADCTAFATVSRIDALWWRALGMRAFHVQNPFVHPKNADLSRRPGEDGTTNLIWVGRQAEPKQPSAALAAFARVHAAEPKTRLTMIGGSAAGWKPFRKAAARLGCADAVEFISERPDLNAYWEKAHIHLLTSVVESFCLVWAEAKAAAIPTVMYELPYLELAEDPRGYVAVEQRNIEALADAVLALVRDPERRRIMGEEAKESLAAFNDEAVWTSWQRLFEGLKTDTEGWDVPKDLKTVVEQIYAAYAFRKEKHQWEENMEADFRKLTRWSLRPFARFLERCVEMARKIKHV